MVFFPYPVFLFYLVNMNQLFLETDVAHNNHTSPSRQLIDSMKKNGKTREKVIHHQTEHAKMLICVNKTGRIALTIVHNAKNGGCRFVYLRETPAKHTFGINTSGKMFGVSRHWSFFYLIFLSTKYWKWWVCHEQLVEVQWGLTPNSACTAPGSGRFFCPCSFRLHFVFYSRSW